MDIVWCHILKLKQNLNQMNKLVIIVDGKEYLICTSDFEKIKLELKLNSHLDLNNIRIAYVESDKN